MCGICGIVRADGGISSDDCATVKKMVGVLRHRGPDGSGLWNDDNVAFGHARLSIIDISGGHQPMFNEDGQIAVTFNGEIYNFGDLKRELMSLGHGFKTNSDTEVVVHGYEEWGNQVVERLRGMFAFAIWDGHTKRLLLARDRFGEKPMYLWRGMRGQLIFASEIKALCAHPAFPRAMNEQRLPEYLAFRSISGPETLFRDVIELSPGMIMTIDGGGTTSYRYWYPGKGSSSETREAVIDHGRDLLIDAVRVRMMSDVPLGTITSGGLDSSLVSAIASELAERPLDTFCVGFGDPAFDERPFARAMADSIGARFHQIQVEAGDLDRELDALTWAQDEPLTHPNSIPMHLLFRYAKDECGVTVLLSGEGADELFGGYDWYRVAHQRHRFRSLTRLSRLMPNVGRLRTLRRVLRPDYLLSANAASSIDAVKRLVGQGDTLGARRSLWPAERDDMDALFLYDQATYLPPLLQRQDRMSMAAGVEARVVFLDHALAEWTNSLSWQSKLAGGGPKPLLKRIAERWIPKNIVERRKVGFTIPLGAWLRSRTVLGRRLDSIREGDAFVRSVCDPTEIDRLVSEHASADADHADILWSLIALECWADVCLK